MKIKSIITIAVAMLLGLSLQAQEQQGPIKPVRLGVALTAGSNSYLSVTAQPGMLTSYGAEALSVGWTDKATAFGMEGSLIFCDRWKLDLGGEFSYYNNPAHVEVPGTYEGNPLAVYEVGQIPDYEAINAKADLNWFAHIAGSYYFRLPSVPCLRPYAGVRFTGGYASNWERTDKYEALGSSDAETYFFTVGALAGVDWYFSPNFFIGIAVEPYRYTFGVTSYRPQEGLAPIAADTHFNGAFVEPRLKVGFLF